jgi:hypothetical protein
MQIACWLMDWQGKGELEYCVGCREGMQKTERKSFDQFT